MNILSELWERPWRSRIIPMLLVINLLGSIYGFYWYRSQLAATPWPLWPLVADSPMSTLLFALVLIMILAGWRWTGLQALAVITNIKYGLWTVLVIFHFWLGGGSVRPLELMLMLSHLGMALQGYLFLRPLRLGLTAAVLPALWLVVNDIVDYGFGLHPSLDTPDQWVYALLAALFMTAMGMLLLAVRR